MKLRVKYLCFIFLIMSSCPGFCHEGADDDGADEAAAGTGIAPSTGFVNGSVAIQGQLLVGHADDYKNKRPVNFYHLYENATKKYYRLKFKNHCGRHLVTGQNLKVHGFKNNSDMTFELQDDAAGSVEDLDHRPMQALTSCQEGQDLSPNLHAESQVSGTAIIGKFNAAPGAFPLSTVPILHSNSKATAKIYLDFVGASAAMDWGGYGSYVTPAFDQDGDPTTFSSAELSAIQQIWARVAEKYSPFNVDITTDPTTPSYTLVIGGNGSWTGGNYGGISYVGVFVYSWGPKVSWIFSSNLGNDPHYTAEATSHELGHALGLSHHSVWSNGTNVNEYDTGNSLIAPILGDSYYSQRGIWENGLSDQCSTCLQDDTQIISTNNGFGYRPTDGSFTINNTSATATSLNIAGSPGIIEKITDADYFTFTSPAAGPVTLTGATVTDGPTLALKLLLLDSNKNVIATAASASTLGQTLTAALPAAGQYYVEVASFGNYGDLGQYTLSGILPTANTYSLTVNASNGSVAQSVNGAAATGPYNTGTQVKITATPANGYQFSSWSGGMTGTTNPATVTMSANMNITANFIPLITAPVVSAGSVQSITLPATASLSGTASDNNPFPSMVYTWARVSGSGTVSFTNSSALSTGASFSAAGTYVLSLTAVDGALSGSANVTVTVNPAPVPPTVSITSPVNNASLTAPANITLTAAASASNGTVSKVVFNSTSCLNNICGTVTSSPYTVTLNSVPVGTYSFTATATDSNGLTATSSAVTETVSAPVVYAITATAGANGAISPGNVSVNAGASQVFTVTPNAGYQVNQALVDGSAAALSNNTYAFNNVTAAHTISVSFSPMVNTLAAPINVVATPVSDTEINLVWDRVESSAGALDETSITLWRSTAGGAYAKLAVLPAGSNVFTDTSCYPSTSYSYQVSSDNSAGSSVPSTAATAATMPRPSGNMIAPTVAAQTAASPFAITLSWTDNTVSSNDTWYIERSMDNVSYTAVAMVPGNGIPAGSMNTYTDTLLLPSVTYYYRIRMISWDGFTDYSLPVEATTQARASGTPIEPTGLTAVVNNATSTTLTWTDTNNAAASYLIETAPGTWSTQTWTQVAKTAVGATTYNLVTTANNFYYVRIRASNANGNSGYVPQVKVRSASAGTGSPKVYKIGPGQTYTSLGALNWWSLGPGDTVNIYPNKDSNGNIIPYYEKPVINVRGTAVQPITITGIPDPVTGQLPIIDGSNATMVTPAFPSQWAVDYMPMADLSLVLIGGNPVNTGKSFWSPGYLTLENLELRNGYDCQFDTTPSCSANPHPSFTAPDGSTQLYGNTSGVYIVDGDHITIKGCLIHDNDEGIFAAGMGDQRNLENITIDSNYIYNNGTVNGYSYHNSYIEGLNTVYQFNKYAPLRNGASGNGGLKDRGAGTIIRYNWINGGGHLLDLVETQNYAGTVLLLPSYHQTYVYGNVFYNDQAGTMFHYCGDQGLTPLDRKGILHFYNNTVINTVAGAQPFFLTDNGAGSTCGASLDARNNIFYSTAGAYANLLPTWGNAYFGPNWNSSQNPLYDPNKPFTGYAGGVSNFINNAQNDPGFISAANNVFQLFSTSQAIDKSAVLSADESLLPVQFQYAAPVTTVPLSAPSATPRVLQGAALDLGAFEQSTTLSVLNVNVQSITETSAMFTWQTNNPGDSQVFYGASSSYGSVSTFISSLVNSHSVTITGLTPNTTYHFLIKSHDAGGNLASSTDMVFKTHTQFTITASSDSNGTITPSGSTSVEETTSMTFTMAPTVVGYQIADVLVDGVSVLPAVINNTYTLTNVEANHAVSVTFQPIPGANAAQYVKIDTATSGNWKNVYGSQGYNFDPENFLPADPPQNPSYGTLSVTNAYAVMDASSTVDPRALQSVSGTDRVAASWYIYHNTVITMNVSFTDTQWHQVALYMLDWANTSQINTVQIKDAVSGTNLLPMQTVSSFNNGKYAVYNLKGNIEIDIGTAGGSWPPGLVSGVFFDAPAGIKISNPPTVSLTADNASYTAPATIVLTAAASEVNGSISKVVFNSSSCPNNICGTVTSSPYAVTLNNIPVGTYAFTATATDGTGVSVTSSPVTVTVNAPPLTYTLNITAANGAVAQSVNGTPSSGPYNAGTAVTLTATPASGYQFSSWSGDATGTVNPVTVTMGANKNVTANFTSKVDTTPPVVSAITTPGTIDADPNTPGLQVPLGSTVTYHATATDDSGSFTWQWIYTINGSSNEFIKSSGSGPAITDNAFTYSNNPVSYTWIIRVKDAAGNMSQQSLNVDVENTLPVITTQPSSQTVTAGQTASFSTSATGIAPLSYQWQKNGNAIAGATSPSYTTPVTVSGDNGASYTVVVSNNSGFVTSNAAILTVNPATYTLSINQQTGGTVSTNPSLTSYPSGTTVTLTAHANAGFAANGWAGTYHATGTISGTSLTIIMDENSTVTPQFVVQAPTITTQPANQSVNVGQAATFSVAAAGTGTLSYQWRKNGAAISGATASSYTTPATAIGDDQSKYTVVVSNAGGPVTSNAANLTLLYQLSVTSINGTVTRSASFFAAGATVTLTASPASGFAFSSWSGDVTGTANPVNFTMLNRTMNVAANFVVAVIAPTISSQPNSQTVNAGQTASFSVTAAGGAPLSYQWQKNGTNISGATSSSYTTPVTTSSNNGDSYKVTVSNSAGSVTSNAAVLTVIIPPSISTQPAAATVNAGQSAVFTITATGTAPFSYQWKKNGASITGATSSSYTTPVLTGADDGESFSVVVSNAAGSVTSQAAPLSVHVGPSFVSQPLNQTVYAGKKASFSVLCNGTSPMSYQWQKNGTAISGATNNTYMIPATSLTDNGEVFTVVVTNVIGSITSATAKLTVNPAPFIISKPPTPRPLQLSPLGHAGNDVSD